MFPLAHSTGIISNISTWTRCYRNEYSDYWELLVRSLFSETFCSLLLMNYHIFVIAIALEQSSVRNICWSEKQVEKCSMFCFRIFCSFALLFLGCDAYIVDYGPVVEATKGDFSQIHKLKTLLFGKWMKSNQILKF